MSTPASHHPTTLPLPSPAERHDRAAIAQLLHDGEQASQLGSSLRHFARQCGLPKTTLHNWHKQHQQRRQQHPEAAFFDSPQGTAFLARLHLALHLVFAQQHGCSLRSLQAFLRLCELDRFLAASYGAQQHFASQLEQHSRDYEQQQRQDLAAGMSAKEISICSDETFHPQCCLVGMEPVSGFLLIEHYAQQRDQHTWDLALEQGLDGLPVTVVQVVSDEAQGLLAHAKKGLGVPHAPDLFHVSRDCALALGPTLARQHKAEQERLARVQQRTEDLRQQQQRAQNRPPRPGRRPDYDAHIGCAERIEEIVAADVERAQQRQVRLRQALRDLSAAYHPFDLDSGQARWAPEVEASLATCVGRLEELAKEAKLSEAGQQRLAKGKRVLPQMVAALAFFWLRVAKVPAGLAEPVRGVWMQLLAGEYLKRVAGQQKGAERRQAVRALGERLLAGLVVPVGVSAQAWSEAQRLAVECAGWFCRGSSCVEGRNGVLSLRHHQLHHLRPGKLKVLTILHNYWVRRPDGTTAAGRFFGEEPEDLFAWLLQRLKAPARPAQRRHKAA
jgi:transposase-like protein